VKPVIVGLLTEGFTVEAIETMPERVTIEGPKSVVNRIYMVKTEPIDVTGINKNIRYSIPLSLTNPDIKTDIQEVDVKIFVKKIR
jgi:YbbR domain-containing protein